MGLSQIQLDAFYSVAKTGSFTKAASALNVTQSALSHRIKNLEEDLQTTLFVRDPKGVRMTHAGEKLLQYCRIKDQIEDELISDIQKFGTSETAGTAGILRIGGASTLMWSVVVPALGDFIRKHPDVQLDFAVRELYELPKLLQAGQVDFILSCDKHQIPNTTEVHLGYERNVLVTSSKWKTRASTFIDHDPDDQTTSRYLKGDTSLRKTQRSFMDDIYGIIAGVAEGIGQAVIPLHLVKNHPRIQVVKGAKIQRTPVYMYYLKQPFYSRLHQATISVITKEVTRMLSDE